VPHSALVPGSDGRDRLVAIFDIPGETGMESVSTEQVSIGVETVRNPPVWKVESDLWDEGAIEAVGDDDWQADSAGREAPGVLLKMSQRAWERAFGGVPDLRCSDPYIEAAWNHRWYALHMLELQMGDLTLTHHPLDLGLQHLKCTGIPYRGRNIDVELADGQAKISVDGRIAAEGPWGEPLDIPLE